MTLKQTIFITINENEDGVGIDKKLLQRIKKLGHIDETINDVIEDILNHCDVCDRFWENRT